MLRVGLLLPLTGGNAPLGQAMLNAAQLALFDQGDRRVEMLPRDTRGTPAGAARAAQAALADGAVALAGPLTLAETAQAVGEARGRAPVFAFTSDETQAGTGVWVLGVTPSQQVRRIIAAAAEGGLRRFALMAPDDAFGQRLAVALRAAAQNLGAPPPLILLSSNRGDMAATAQQLVASPPEAVLIGYGGPGARAAGNAIAAAFPAGAPRLLGTNLWVTDGSLGNEPALIGAWFPGPDPVGRARFDAQYDAAFNERAPRLAGAAYDAVALAARSAREGAPPVGAAFMGADGPVRLLEAGGITRGLAVFAIRQGGEAELVQPAPLPGGPGS
ncbi:penicillin-binding protein activator [Sediminicoccus sp. KRV36]|uniref:penicillin-binding protein activator n=1 Tax=Sediminicoccus sp. KRV36 TaxID=3133721 RepID=UPI00200E4073|nr:penicillin-binding protein activator [Sediminicoccus rosea]UPY36375.1 penicillin-binding protein activator [Sediminicoccus rosea]